MKRIAVIIAGNGNFRNTGMMSVDYAAYFFFKHNYPDHYINLYALSVSPEKDYPYQSIMPYSVYKEITEDTLYDIIESDLIVYWGDFLHTYHYFDQYICKYLLPKCKSFYEKENFINLYFDAFFLAGWSREIFEKTIVFGSSFMFAEDKDFDNHLRYATNFKYFYEKINWAASRDPLSSSKLRVRTGREDFDLGCDPAFLIEYPELGFRKDRTLGVFLGRRTEIDTRTMSKIESVARHLKMKVEWIPWMINQESTIAQCIEHPRRTKNLLLSKYYSSKYKGGEHGFESQFLRLSDHSLIITDTYHLCVNALAEGVPTIGIGKDGTIYGKTAKDLHDKKKEVLFQMYSLRGCYFDVEEFTIVSAILAYQGFFSPRKSLHNYKCKVKLLDKTNRILNRG